MSDTVVTLDHWEHPIYGDRWSLIWQGQMTYTFGTEAEARAAADRNGWRIDEDDEGLEREG